MKRQPTIGRRPRTATEIAVPELPELRHVQERVVQLQQDYDQPIYGYRIAELAITETHIADDSISTPKLQANSVTTNELAALTLEVGKYIESDNYSVGSAGWHINADGDAEFNDVTVRGIFDTATSGNRIRIWSNAGSPEIRLYTGNTDEDLPGRLHVTDTVNDEPLVQILCPQFYSGNNSRPWINLWGADQDGNIGGLPIGGGIIQLNADNVDVAGNLEVNVENASTGGIHIWGDDVENSLSGNHGTVGGAVRGRTDHAISFEWDNTNIKFYVDGTLVKTL